MLQHALHVLELGELLPCLAAICWDQWFPEAARAMVLQGAEILLYPTAIGSEPQDQELDSREHWKRVMQGHAGANLVNIVAPITLASSTRLLVNHFIILLLLLALLLIIMMQL